MTLTIPPVAFARTVYRTFADFFPATDENENRVKWTDEALELLQTSCEAFLHRLVENAVGCAIHGHRRVVENRDVQWAARIMGLRE
jgi:histone H3/H4